MTALDDFIAQDQTRDFVDLHSNVRWTELDVRSRTEMILASVYSIETQRIMGRKVDVYQLQKVLALSPDPELQLPAYTLTLPEKQEIQAFGQMSLLCGALKDVMWARAQRLTPALDYEDARAILSAFPPVEEGVPDPWANERATFQAVIDGATQDTLDLVAERDAWRAGQLGG